MRKKWKCQLRIRCLRQFVNNNVYSKSLGLMFIDKIKRDSVL